MLSSRTPEARRVLWAPETRASMMEVFQRAWTMAMRRGEPEVVSVIVGLHYMGKGGEAATIMFLSGARTFERCHCESRLVLLYYLKR